jgi:hypothetical protein
MSVNSVTSSGVLWEEYIERQKQLRQKQQTGETSGGEAAGAAFDMTPDQLLAQLESVEGDQEQLRALASEFAAQAKEAAGASSGKRGDMLNELAADLEAVAETGDLSVIREKVERGRQAAASGVSNGAGDIHAKSVQGILEEEEDDEEDEEDENNNGIPDSLESIDELSTGGAANLSAQLRETYAQGGTQHPTISVSG